MLFVIDAHRAAQHAVAGIGPDRLRRQFTPVHVTDFVRDILSDQKICKIIGRVVPYLLND